MDPDAPSSREPPTEILPATREPDATSRADGPQLLGRSLGKFTVVEKLGRGGSGDVYRAEQVQLGRSAVIKVLRREVATAPNRVERFLREAKLASKLDHPYAAHVYAFGAEPDGVLWIAMEYIQGATLDELVSRRGPMPASVFGPLFARLCEVVHTAHELGIVHRDIKGSNVMVIERAGQLLPKLLDFGIAKGLEGGVSPGTSDGGAGSGSGALTGHGSTLGSPHYMAPEQWTAPADVDARADIYALGVLAYRCVSGRLPYQTVERAGLANAHLTMSPPPLPSSVLPAIVEVIGRALAKQPQARWASALGFGEALRGATLGAGGAPETVPIFEPSVRDAWVQGGPQPIADAVARLARATTTVEADASLRELVAITCRWLAVLGLAQLEPARMESARTPDPQLRERDAAYTEVRERARGVTGRDDAGPWVRLARAATRAEPALPALEAALAGASALEALADRLDDRDRMRTAAGLAFDVTAAADALRGLEPLLAYQLVVGVGGAAESWQGTRRRDRERVVVWGEPIADGVVALLDGTGRVVAKLSPLVQVIAPLPSAEPELFILWRSARGHARLVAAPWGFERDDDAAAARLASLTTENTDTYADLDAERSPYPGLAPYAVGDAERFVGREREIESLANRLVRAPLLAVLGPSGAGKSSFIHAGVLPRLAEHHEIITMRPGRHPLHALAALPGLGVDTEDSDGLVTKLRVLGERAPRGLLLVVDQFEELVTLCADEAERRAFAETLARAADGPSAPVRVIVTLRDDFASVIESQDALRGRFEVFVLATPAPEALRRIVIEPARRARVSVDARVVDDMVAEVAGRPASLPLLSFTASQLWERRERDTRKITYDAYLAIGGVAGALSTYADHVYASLARRDQDVVRDLFSRLVASDGTRIPSPRSELEGLAGAPAVLGHLVDARLLVVREDDGLDVVEIVHECLAERWPRLARWRSEDAADRALLGDVRVAARRWTESGRRGDLLWRGAALAELRKLAARSTAMTAREVEFATASDRAALRSRRIRRAIVVAVMTLFAGVAVVMAYLGIAANRSREAAETSAGEAQVAAKLAEERLTASLVAQGRRELNDNHAIAALAYFGEALRRGADTPALRLMLAYAARGWRFERPVAQWDVNAFHATATTIVTGDIPGTLSWRDPRGTLRGELALGLGYIYEVSGTSDRQLFVACRDGTAVVDLEQRAKLHTIKHKSQPYGISGGPGADEVTLFEPSAIRIYGFDGALRREAPLATQTSSPPVVIGKHVFYELDGVLRMLDLFTLKTRLLLEKGRSMIAGHGAPFVAVLDEQRSIRLYSGKDGSEIRKIRSTNQPNELEVSEDGQRIAAISDHDIVIYDAEGEIRAIVPTFGKRDSVWMTDNELWTGSADGVVRRFIDDDLVASIPRHVSDIEYLVKVGDSIVTRGADGIVAITDAKAQHYYPEPRPCQHTSFGPEGIAIAYLCEGRQLVYVGKHKVADTKDASGYGSLTHDPLTKRTAVSGTQLEVYDAQLKRLGASPSHEMLGGLSFEDADHLLVVNPPRGPGLWRWAFASDRWERLGDLGEDPGAVLAAANRAVLVGEPKAVTVYRDGHPHAKIPVRAAVMGLTSSRDRRWVAVQLENGETLLLDGHTFAVMRALPPSDGQGTSAIFDARGDFLLRMQRDMITIWERTTGEDVVRNLDLFRDALGGAFLDDGRLELTGRSIGLLDIPREVRPASEILRDVECRVRLKVTDGKLEPAKPSC